MLLHCVCVWKSCYVYTVGGAHPSLQPLLHRQVGGSHEGSVLARAKAVHNVSKVNHCKIVFLIYL